MIVSRRGNCHFGATNCRDCCCYCCCCCTTIVSCRCCLHLSAAALDLPASHTIAVDELWRCQAVSAHLIFQIDIFCILHTHTYMHTYTYIEIYILYIYIYIHVSEYVNHKSAFHFYRTHSHIMYAFDGVVQAFYFCCCIYNMYLHTYIHIIKCIHACV